MDLLHSYRIVIVIELQTNTLLNIAIFYDLFEQGDQVMAFRLKKNYSFISVVPPSAQMKS